MQKLRYIYILTATALVLTSAGCNKFLEIKPKGLAVAETYDHYNGLLSNINLLNWNDVRVHADGSYELLGGVEANVLMSDDIFCDTPYFSSLSVEEQNMYKWSDDVFLPADDAPEWGAFYVENYVYNVVANNVMGAPGGTEEQRKSVLAEARMCRAGNHWWLLQFFSRPYDPATASTDPGIPIVQTAQATLSDFRRSTVKEVYDFILAEMNASVHDLPAQTTGRVRVAKAAGFFMLGQVYFSQHDYANALAALDSCRNALADAAIPVGLYDYNSEMDGWIAGSGPYMGAPAYPGGFSNEEIFLLRQSGAVFNYAYGSVVYLAPAVYGLFQPSDLRLKFFSNTDYFSGTTLLPGYQRVTPLFNNFGPSVADLYLMLAECKARTNDLAGAKSDLEYFRSHRMPAADATVTAAGQKDMVQFCIDERQREFAGTGMRWLDMRRLSQDPLVSVAAPVHPLGGQTYTFKPERYAMRIPPKILATNPHMENNP